MSLFSKATDKTVKVFHAEAPILLIVSGIITAWIVLIVPLFFLRIVDIGPLLIVIPALFDITLLLWIFGFTLTISEDKITSETLSSRHEVKYAEITKVEAGEEQGSHFMQTDYPLFTIYTADGSVININMRPYSRRAGYLLAKEIADKAPNAQTSKTIKRLANQVNSPMRLS